MINDRINFIISALNLNANSFSDKVGVSPTVIYNIVKGRRNKPSYDLILKILEAFEQINVQWLIQGDGQYWFKSEETDTQGVSLAEKFNYLIETIENDSDASVESVELAELTTLLLDNFNSQQKELENLKQQNHQIMELLRKRLGLNI